MAAMASLASAGISHSQIRPPALANPNHSHSSPVRPVVVVFSGSLALWLSGSRPLWLCLSVLLLMLPLFLSRKLSTPHRPASADADGRRPTAYSLQPPYSRPTADGLQPQATGGDLRQL